MPHVNTMLLYSKLDIQRSQIAEEERRKTVQYENDIAKRRAEYQV